MTTTLEMIGVTVIGGSFVCITTIIIFGFVLRKRHIFLAPRATARPRDVIYNPSARSTVNDKGNINIDRHVQDRGNPFIGWIPWTLSLRYDTMLRGIPGTGTRQNGLAGTMLSVTLDGIVLLRFHALGLRISSFVTILSIFVLMPIYKTSTCQSSCDLDDYESTSYSTVSDLNMTSYEQLTILNVPALLSTTATNATTSTPTTKDVIALGNPDGLRLYGVVLVFWIIMFYAFRELRQEWIQLLAMRRVYYLEFDIYGERKKQLERTRLFTNSLATFPSSGSGNHSYKQANATVSMKKRKSSATNKQQFFQEQQKIEDVDESDGMAEHSQPFETVTKLHERRIRSSMVVCMEDSHLMHREPYIPHPEFAETVPNVSLYSILVGGLPSLPKHALSTGTSIVTNNHSSINKTDYEDSNFVFSKREQVDWQLSLTTAFFDHCVPNQPGFSSSIAAVTVIPGAKAMAIAWKKWAIAAAKLRKLRFIHEQIAYKLASIQEQEEIYVPEHLADSYLFHESTNDNVSKTAEKASAAKCKKKSLSSSLTCNTKSDNKRSPSNRVVLWDLESGFQVSTKHVDQVLSSPSTSTAGFISPASERMSTTTPSPTALSSQGKMPTLPYELNSVNSRNARIPDKTQAYYRQMLGSFTTESLRIDTNYDSKNIDVDDNNDGNEKANEHENSLAEELLAFGPEQSAVYSREFAQVASGCNPNGVCCESRISKLSLDELLKMKEIVEEETMRAYDELKHARDKAAVFSDYANKDASVHTSRGSSQRPQSSLHNRNGDILASILRNGGMNTMTAIEEHDSCSMSVANQEDHRDGSNARTDESLDGSCKGKKSTCLSNSFNDLPLDTNDEHNESDVGFQQGTSLHYRSKPTLEKMRLPNDLGLEAHLYRETSFDTRISNFSKKPSYASASGIFLSPLKHMKSDESNASTGTGESFTAPTHTPPRKGPLKLMGPTRPGMSRSSTIPSPPRQPQTVDVTPSTNAYPYRPRARTVDKYSNHNMNSGNDSVEWLLVPDLNQPQNETSVEDTAFNVSDKEKKNPAGDGFSLTTGRVGEQAQQVTISVENDEKVVDEHKPLSFALDAQNQKVEDPPRFLNELEHTPASRWQQVESIVNEALDRQRSRSSNVSSLTNGAWNAPSLQEFIHDFRKQLRRWFHEQKKKAVDSVARDSTFAVITFTSRQAAVAARACLADGRGHRRWLTLKEIPIPPLADAPSWDPGFRACRNCCQPVTISMNEQQKILRHLFCILLLGFIYVFYTIPLTLTSQLVDHESLQILFPEMGSSLAFNVTGLLSGLLTAGIWSAFFTVCPVMFMAIANFGSKATSVAHAEYNALHYFWWFMVLTAFSGQTIANMGLKGFTEGFELGSDFKSVLSQIATTIPTVTAITWLNWILFRFLIILPLNYLLMINTFVFDMIGLSCCSRILRGGGPGGPVPYRLYIDSGMVFLCLMAISPVAPIIAPPCFFYFLFIQPLLRRNLIFVYRPRFDGGGNRWPFIFRMCISSMIVGIILLTMQLILKQATGPAILAGLSLGPTLYFNYEMRKRYLRSYEDAALCQTSMLDGWYDESEFTFNKREEFRRFLVDAHKAAYVPVCLASPDTEDFLTAEPAVVVPQAGEEIQTSESAIEPESINRFVRDRQHSIDDVDEAISSNIVNQHGVSLRRASLVLSSLNRERTPVANSNVRLETPNEMKIHSFRSSTELLHKED